MKTLLRTPLTQTLTTAIPCLYPDDPPATPLTPTPELPAPPAELPDPKPEDKPADPKPEDKPEDKPADPKPEDKPADPKPEDKPAEAVVPEAYELKVKDDKGEEVVLDAKLVEAATPIFKELKLTQDQAQGVVQHYAAAVLPQVAQTVQWETLRLLGLDGMADWAGQLKTDKDIGGAKYAENLTIIAQGRDAFASPELRTLLETSRLGNHPEINRLFLKLGKQVAEGKVHAGPAGGPTATGVEAFYDPAFSPKS